MAVTNLTDTYWSLPYRIWDEDEYYIGTFNVTLQKIGETTVYRYIDVYFEDNFYQMKISTNGTNWVNITHFNHKYYHITGGTDVSNAHLLTSFNQYGGEINQWIPFNSTALLCSAEQDFNFVSAGTVIPVNSNIASCNLPLNGVVSYNGLSCSIRKLEFASCTNLESVDIIPNTVTDLSSAFSGCSNLAGRIQINANPTSYSNCFKDTTLGILIYGSSSKLTELAATANNGNVLLAPSWVEPVTNRTSNSRTTYTDMNRIMGNCVNVGGPVIKWNYGNEFVTKDEWDSLIEYARTLDNSITSSSLYSNLNKIEQAFKDAHN